MSGIAAVAFDQLMQSRAGRWTLLAVIFSSLFLAGFVVNEEKARHTVAIERREASLQLWLSECAKPVDECAAAWDDSYTLRELYRAKVTPHE